MSRPEPLHPTEVIKGLLQIVEAGMPGYLMQQDIRVQKAKSYLGQEGEFNIYNVQVGDTLSGISVALYGDTTWVDEIVRLNKIEDPNLILPGQVLRLPDVP